MTPQRPRSSHFRKPGHVSSPTRLCMKSLRTTQFQAHHQHFSSPSPRSFHHFSSVTLRCLPSFPHRPAGQVMGTQGRASFAMWAAAVSLSTEIPLGAGSVLQSSSKGTAIQRNSAHALYLGARARVEGAGSAHSMAADCTGASAASVVLPALDNHSTLVRWTGKSRKDLWTQVSSNCK